MGNLNFFFKMGNFKMGYFQMGNFKMGNFSGQSTKQAR